MCSYHFDLWLLFVSHFTVVYFIERNMFINSRLWPWYALTLFCFNIPGIVPQVKETQYKSDNECRTCAFVIVCLFVCVCCLINIDTHRGEQLTSSFQMLNKFLSIERGIINIDSLFRLYFFPFCKCECQIFVVYLNKYLRWCACVYI